MKTGYVAATVVTLIVAAVATGLYLANAQYRRPRAEAADAVRTEAHQILDALNQDPAARDPDPRRAEAAAKRHLGTDQVFGEETRADGYTVSRWFSTDWYVGPAPHEVVLCVAFVGQRGTPLVAEDRNCPPNAGTDPGNEEYVKLSD
ncbi:MAG TPA: hypothetical protein VGH57_25915 [Amycolatopsis sp.]